MRLSDVPGIALKIGVIVALITSWSAFQTLVFDLATRAPLEIADVVSAPAQADSAFASDPVAGLQDAYDQLSGAATSLGKAAGSTNQVFANHKGQSAELLTIAADVLFLGCAGLIAVITIALGVLSAIGPVFVTLLLFFETRGFFIGWVRALAAAAFALLSTWTLIVLMLHVFEPWLQELAQQSESGSLDEQTATTAAAIVFVFAACQLVMIIAGFVIALGFSPTRKRQMQSARHQVFQRGDEPALLAALSRPARLAEQLQRPGAAASLAKGARLTPAFHAAPAAIIEAPGTAAAHSYRRPFLSYADQQSSGEPA
jgi:type IV secretion system protein VirB6